MRVGEVFLVIGVPVSFRGPSENMRKSTIAKLATRIFLISRPRYHSCTSIYASISCVCVYVRVIATRQRPIHDPVRRLWSRWWSPESPAGPAAPPLTTASRRHLECPRPAGRLRVTTTCHHRPTQPVTVPPGCVCRAGRGQGSHDEPFRGCPRPPRAIWG